MKNVHIVPHIHWDREWYFSDEESKILLVNDMKEILDTLENNDNYPYFVLDGQTSILEDYLSYEPNDKYRIKDLVLKGKLIIGPWYTQTDEMIVGGESILRNLLYGIKDCKEFGDFMKIGYLPDSFGQSAQMPQILNGFGIKESIFWRGCSERKGTNKTEFYWSDPIGNKVLVQILPLGYAIGKYLPENEVDLQKRMDKYLPVLDKGATTDNILLPNGHDQMPIQKNIFTIIDKLNKLYPTKNFFLSKYENVFEELYKNYELDNIQGEFLDGKYMRVHRSIFSSRADIKTMNTRIENKLTNILEPLASIAFSLGFDYHHGIIESIWKEIMKNHAHDSIGCCCSDKVHKTIVNRFFTAEERLDSLIEFYKRKIVDAMSVEISLDKLTIFNFLPYERNSVITAEFTTKMLNFSLFDAENNELDFEILSEKIIDAGIIDRQIVHYGDYDPFVQYTIAFKDKINAMGYKTYFIKESDKMISTNDPKILITNNNILENEFYKITIVKNGTLVIFHKETSETYKNVLLVEDGADDGDGYDFSELENDFIITSLNSVATTTITKSKYKQSAVIKLILEIPQNLDSRKNKLIDGKIQLIFNIELLGNSKNINIKLDVTNNCYDHRVRVLIPNNYSSEFSISDNQFGKIKRPVYDSAMQYWEKENWDERPDSIYPMLSYVGLDIEKGLSILTNSIREFEIIGETYNTIAITVFRCTGYLGKENLYRRPGRPSGIKLPTLDSQMIGKNSYEFALTSNSKYLGRIAKEYLTPLSFYNKMPYNAMKLNPTDFNTCYDYSFFSEDNNLITMSVLKKAENSNGFIFRAYNSLDDQINMNIHHVGLKNFAITNLNEDFISEIKNTNDIKILPNEIMTITFQK